MQDVALVGHMRSGKDSIAACLIKLFGYQRFTFAGALKDEVAKALNAVNNSPEGITPETFDADRTRYRPLLQWWGTEYRRATDPDYWVRKVETQIDRTTGPIVVTDARFTNELEMLRSRNFKLIELRMVERELHTYLIGQGMTDAEIKHQLEHASEREWQEYPKDHIYESRFGNLVELTGNVLRALDLALSEELMRAFYHDLYPNNPAYDLTAGSV